MYFYSHQTANPTKTSTRTCILHASINFGILSKLLLKSVGLRKVIQSSFEFALSNTSALGPPPFVERVLDVEKGQMCWVVGTVYKDMPLKDNVLEDLAKDVCLAFFMATRIPVDILPALDCSTPSTPKIPQRKGSSLAGGRVWPN